MNLGPTELIIILVIVLVLFGSTRLPKLARSMGQASKEFKKGINEGETAADEDKPEKPESSEKPEKKEDSA
jgi:sec-independent protein translocase protein TatA